jgi:hypothetical protein
VNAIKTHAFIKEWRQLSADRKSLAYREARWAHNLRSECPDGDSGDRAFYLWLEIEIGMPPKEREAMLDKARAFKVVPDQATWDAQGSGQIRQIVRMPRTEQIAILDAAKVEGKKIGDVIRARDRARSVREITPVRPRADRVTAPLRTHERSVPTGQDDATVIAGWARQLGAEVLADALAEQIAIGILAAPLHVVAAAKRRVSARRRTSGRKAA